MPGSGKSAVGEALAARLGWDFIDTDRQIEAAAGTSLQQLLDEQGYLALRAREAEHIQSLSPSRTVISTGGSAVYSEPAMTHLRDVSTVVYLDIDLDTVEKRVRNFGQRGIASAQNQSLASIFAERSPLYQRFADVSVPNSRDDIEQTVSEIIKRLELAGQVQDTSIDAHT